MGAATEDSRELGVVDTDGRPSRGSRARRRSVGLFLRVRLHDRSCSVIRMHWRGTSMFRRPVHGTAPLTRSGRDEIQGSVTFPELSVCVQALKLPSSPLHRCTPTWAPLPRLGPSSRVCMPTPNQFPPVSTCSRQPAPQRLQRPIARDYRVATKLGRGGSPLSALAPPWDARPDWIPLAICQGPPLQTTCLRSECLHPMCRC
jgi:hypothetical protein